MEILINVEKSPTGRLAGTVRATGSQSATCFDGTMELLAAVERICTAEDGPESP
jgi:predicted RNA methylase